MKLFSNIQAGSRMFVFLTLTLICMPFYTLSRTPGTQRRVAEFWFLAVSRIVGVNLRAFGQAHREGPVLYVANHVSYLDIFVLGMCVDAVFVAKQEVADWPLLGRLARMRQCIFVTRNATHVRDEVELIRAQLLAGRNIILFPEGTTGDGGKLLPFKSSLLAAVDGVAHVWVQPISIAYPDSVQGGTDASLAWYGDMAMLPHLWSVLQRGHAPARLHFHPVLLAREFSDRKSLLNTCRAYISSGLATLPGPASIGQQETNSCAIAGPVHVFGNPSG